MTIDVETITPTLTRHTPRFGDRYYTWDTPDGLIKLPSVTVYINGGIPKPWLGRWVAKTIAEKMTAMADEPDYLLRRLQDDDAERWIKGLPYADREKAADLGSLVHRIAEKWSLNEPYEHLLTDEAAPYIDSFQRFWKDFTPTLLASEAPVLNVTRLYAGTLDAILQIGPYKLLVDYKTGKGIYNETALQLAAYRNAEYVYLPDHGVVKMPQVDGACVLHLTPHSYEFIPFDTREKVWRSFLYAREVYRWDRDIASTVQAEPIQIPDALALCEYIDPIGKEEQPTVPDSHAHNPKEGTHSD